MNKKKLILLVAIVGLLVAGVGGWVYMQKEPSATPPPPPPTVKARPKIEIPKKGDKLDVEVDEKDQGQTKIPPVQKDPKIIPKPAN